MERERRGGGRRQKERKWREIERGTYKDTEIEM